MTRIGYSSCNEDAHSEFLALNLQPTDRVLCITGSGARVLDLLTQAPCRIYAVDMNPAQQYLLKLKVAAIQALDYEAFLRFLGVSACTHRLETYRHVRVFLTQDAQNYWDKQTDFLCRGVIYQGNWEQHFKRNALLSRRLRRKKHDALLACLDVSAQAAFWQQQWDTRFWRFLVFLSSNRLLWRYVLRDPGFYAFVPKDFNLYRYIKGCMDKATRHFLLHQSPFARLLFSGEWDTRYLPPHLQPAYYEALKNRVRAIEYMNHSLLDALESLPARSIDKFSLSDFASYTPEADYQRTWEAILRVAGNEGVVCERQFLVKRTVAQTPQLLRNNALEAHLENTDQSIFYSFIIARVLS